MSDEPPEERAPLHTGTVLLMLVLGLSVPLSIVLQLIMMAAEHGRSSLVWLTLQIGWMYPLAVAFGFTRVLRRRRSEGQVVELLFVPAVVVIAWVMVPLLGSLFGLR